jgi:alkaline phosphatase
MDRRKFFRNSTFFSLGATLLNPFELFAGNNLDSISESNKKAKNIILVISDGMSIGTLNMTDLYLSRKNGKGTNWLQLYKENKISRALMDMASASSMVTDSAAASSSWGGGNRVANGSLNIGPNGEEYLPILQKFKKVGKKVGCVTTVPITHATPAGFCVATKTRDDQEVIAALYLEQKLDVMMGGGLNFFAPDLRSDKRNLIQEYEQKGYSILRSRSELKSADLTKPLLGLFYQNGLPYSIDRTSSAELTETVPTLAEMTQVAINQMKGNSKGFVLQVEAGRVDWAAHGNDIAGLLYDQMAHDEALKVVMDFAEQNKETLVIITSDHGNANPGMIYGSAANRNFDTIQQYRQTNDWILNGINANTTISQIKERVDHACNIGLSDEEADVLKNYYTDLKADAGGWYNPRKLPYKALAEIQKSRNSVGWISMDHSADYTELALFGPGSELLTPFIKNTDLHYLMLNAAHVENKF